MLVRTFASAVTGIDAVTVTIEVNVSQGIRFFLVEFDIGKRTVNVDQLFKQLKKGFVVIPVIDKFLVDPGLVCFFVLQQPIGDIIIGRYNKNPVVVIAIPAGTDDNILQHILKFCHGSSAYFLNGKHSA